MFKPTPNRLLPDLTPREELVLLARILWREGYDDRLAGHITYKQADGTFLTNPWNITWAELTSDQVIRIDIEGRVVEGDWPVHKGIPLHLEVHKRREDVVVAMHNHPRYGTIWADAGKLPPVFDQSSLIGGGELALVEVYEGGVSAQQVAAEVARLMGKADMALLANHGVMVCGTSIRAVHQRAVALETRCRNALHVTMLGGGKEVDRSVQDRMVKFDGNEWIGFFEGMARLELARDPALAASIESLRTPLAAA
jgi:ribulose-5-phosphate 4-epimerase/fuculose-1-phosphate aldolase